MFFRRIGLNNHCCCQEFICCDVELQMLYLISALILVAMKFLFSIDKQFVNLNKLHTENLTESIKKYHRIANCKILNCQSWILIFEHWIKKYCSRDQFSRIFIYLFLKIILSNFDVKIKLIIIFYFLNK